MTNLMLGFIGGTEIMWIAIVVLVLFGAKKVPELMKGVGTGIKEFKKASRDVQDEMQRAMDDRVGTGIKEFKKASRDVQDEMQRAMDDNERPVAPAPAVRPSTDTVTHSPKA
jgi:sec-independent protein translocase protein TatA